MLLFARVFETNEISFVRYTFFPYRNSYVKKNVLRISMYSITKKKKEEKLVYSYYNRDLEYARTAARAIEHHANWRIHF